jgi:hypothetical protein
MGRSPVFTQRDQIQVFAIAHLPADLRGCAANLAKTDRRADLVILHAQYVPKTALQIMQLPAIRPAGAP